MARGTAWSFGSRTELPERRNRFGFADVLIGSDEGCAMDERRGSDDAICRVTRIAVRQPDSGGGNCRGDGEDSEGLFHTDEESVERSTGLDAICSHQARHFEQADAGDVYRAFFRCMPDRTPSVR